MAQAAKVGYFLRKFRLRGKKNSSGNKAYEREAAIACLSAHVPQNPPNSPQSPSMCPGEIQPAENNASPEGTEATEGLGVPPTQDDKTNHGVAAGRGGDFGNSSTTVAVAVLPAEPDANSTEDEMVEGEL